MEPKLLKLQLLTKLKFDFSLEYWNKRWKHVRGRHEKEKKKSKYTSEFGQRKTGNKIRIEEARPELVGLFQSKGISIMKYLPYILHVHFRFLLKMLACQ